MLEQKKEQLKQRILSEALALDNPLGLAVLDDPVYEVPKHLELLNNKLMDVANGKIDRLAVFMPPRHGKSELCSKYFPAWYLGTHPDDRIILSSYEADFAATWGQKVRDIFKSYKEIYGVIVNDRSAARNRWDISGHRGGMATAGVGGPITGKGAEIFIIDDPVKNAEQANSPTYREKAKDWYKSTAYTRLTPTGKIVLIQTRWHEDDLGGWLLNESDDWTVISLPGISNADIPDEMGRSPGQALWPELWSVDKLLDRKRTLGEYWFSAMYQQQPQPPEGGILKRSWIQYYDSQDPEVRRRLTNTTTYTGWDLAISEKETADYTTSCTVKQSNMTGAIYVVDWTRDHITFPEQQQEVIKQHGKWQPDLIGIETVAYQAALPQSLRQYQLPIKGINRIRDKVTRITSSFTAFEQGQVYLPLNHPLLYEFEGEYVHFPTGTHDDLLDATEIAITMARSGSNPYAESDKYYDFSERQRRSMNSRPKHKLL